MVNNKKNSKIVYQEFGNNNDNLEPENLGIELPTNQQNIRIQATKKGRKGKTVTEITGFQTSEDNLKDLLKKLKAVCGCGGTLKDNILEIQGDHCQKILPMLLNLGYKAKIAGGNTKK
jgi:translation initiation factor 1